MHCSKMSIRHLFRYGQLHFLANKNVEALNWLVAAPVRIRVNCVKKGERCTAKIKALLSILYGDPGKFKISTLNADCDEGKFS